MQLPPTLRTLLKAPGFCAVVIVTLALGIGVNATIFSMVDRWIIRGMPVPDGDRVLALNYLPPSGNADERSGVSFPEFREFRAAQRSFVDLGAYETRTAGFIAPGRDPERIEAAVITSAALQAVEAPLLFGRWFSAEEEKAGAAPVVILAEGLWRRLCGSDPAILGKQVRLDGVYATVLGVAPAGYRFPEASDVWTPPAERFGLERREVRNYLMFGRVKPGVSTDDARTELLGLAARQLKDHPENGRDLVPRVLSLSQTNIGSTDRLVLGVMLAAVFLVMLVACANSANLLLVRALSREKELAVRSALGAGRGQLVALIFREASVLAAVGASLGLLLGYAGAALFQRLIEPMQLAYWMTFSLDARAVAYTLGMATLSCLLAGIVPALRLTRPDLNTVLTDAARGSSGHRLGRFAGWLVIGQIALSALLLVLSILTIRSVIKIQTLPLGLDPAGVYTGRVALPKLGYADAAKRNEFHAAWLQRLRERPEVAQAGLCDLEANYDGAQPVVIEDRPAVAPGQRGPSMCLLAITPGYLETLRIGLLEGRDILETDQPASRRVGLVSASFAQRHWPGQSPLGKRFRVPEEAADAWFTVVGVVRDRMQGNFGVFSAPQVYVPLAQIPENERVTAYVRARSGDADALAPVLRAVVRSLNDELPVYFAQPLEVTLRKAHYSKRLIAGMFTGFGVVAALLAAIGLFGVTSYGVAQRTQEFGIRMALGASPGQVMSLVLREGGLRLIIGLALGLSGAVAASQLIAALLYGITTTDPLSFLGTAGLLLLAALAATVGPGLRALRVSPAEALRAE
ncbi:MAG: ABC transporter permease [Verrucomicrobia bacterium]|nr:ABC transporter permease [Verrucomicrobiota bacterium]